MASLIDHETRGWNIAQVQRILAPTTAVKVFKMMLPYVLPVDHLFWELERRGEYSVNSGYRLSKQLEND